MEVQGHLMQARASLKSTRFSQKKVGHFSIRIVCVCVCVCVYVYVCVFHYLLIYIYLYKYK